jgi:outer membrane autotransporter protein
VFASANYQDLDRDGTNFEDGYDSDLWGVMVGAEYMISDTLAAGLALNYTDWDGDFDSGGRFDKDIYGSIVYASFFPREGVFADLVLGYNRIDVSSKRRRDYRNERGQPFGGEVSGDPDDNQFSTSLSVGLDYPIRQFTVGPRLGLDFEYTDLDGYSESGGTGLELNFEDDTETSLQSRLGLQASMAISTTFAVFLPQVRGDWVHEFADDQRSVSVRFVQDLRANPTSFSFENEKPDRDFFEINAGIVAVLPHDIQAFANFWTLQGDKFLDSHAGSVGLRIDF